MTQASRATPPVLPIPQIQGRGPLSSYSGKVVTTSGVITAVQTTQKNPGFFLQDRKGDADAATSDALFVSTLKIDPDQRHAFEAGRSVQVTGRVNEDFDTTTIQPGSEKSISALRRPRGAAGDKLPEPVELQLPASHGGKLSYLEAREGMLATVPNAMVVGATSKYGGFTVVDEKTHGPRHSFDASQAGRRLFISGRIGPKAQMNVGDRVGGIRGPVAHGFDADYEILQTSYYSDVRRGPFPPKMWGDLDFDGKVEPQDIAAIRRREGSPADGPLDPADLTGDGKVSRADVNQAKQRANRVTGQPTFTVGTLNAFNFFDAEDAPPPIEDDVPSQNEFNAKLARMAGAIRDVLQQPDVLALQEVENTAVLDALVARPELKELGYRYALLPTNGHRSINPAILYRGDKVQVENLRQVNQHVRLEGRDGRPQLVGDDGSLMEEGPLFAREPLLADITVRDGDSSDQLTLVVNHLKSKFSPQGHPTEPVRLEQAKFLRGLVQQLREEAPEREVVVLGDLNDTPGSKPMKALVGPASDPTLVNTTEKLVPKGERYSYTFKGQSELIDHILVTPGMLDRVEVAGVNHVNSDLGFGLTWNTTPYGTSDHDSPYMRVRFPAGPPQGTGDAAVAARRVQPRDGAPDR